MQLEDLRALVGRWSEPVWNEAQPEAWQRFAEAACLPWPCGQPLTAPPTWSRTLDYGRIPGLDLPASGLLHGEQAFFYERPIRPGERLACRSQLAEVMEKTGRQGPMWLLTLHCEARDEAGQLVVQERVTLIWRRREGDV
ncbi:MAG: MaoC family dehydratase N-terminal domain-containing protein [Alicyclobacillus sp.]|nr:MaoC family dehydratase N-terminal domain-containing protein [Alicyclobacillus sp.]